MRNHCFALCRRSESDDIQCHRHYFRLTKYMPRWNSLWALGLSLTLMLAPQALAQRLSPAGIAQVQALIADKQNRSPDELKIDSNLLFAARAAKNAQLGIRTALPVYVENFIAEEVKGDGTVNLNIRASISDALIDALKAIGASDIQSFAQYDTVTARIPVADVYQIAALADVRFISPLEKAITNSSFTLSSDADANKGGIPPMPNVGSVTSQGVFAHAADLAIASGISGAGGMVCVVSNGVDSAAARQATGDLPIPLNYLSGQLGSGDEGTAMLEIVHDLAPGAALGFATGNPSQAQMATNILNLRSVLGCAIIVDDVSYFAENAFQDGPIAQAVNSVTAAGALYFSSAANSGNLTHGTSGTWEGDWFDSGYLLGGLPMQRFGTNPYDVVTSGAGDFLSLKWSDPSGASSNDYDMYLFDSTGSTILKQSANPQTGIQDPFEGFSCSGGTCPAGSLLVVLKYSGSARALRVDTHRGRLSVNTSGSTYGHNAASTALSVAAVDVATASGGRFVGGSTNPVEYYSSDGPRRLFYFPNGTAITPGNLLFGTGGGTTLSKVDLAAADDVSTSTPGYSPFRGTSAAAPHAAALAALVWSAHPSNTAATVKSALLSSALDIEAPGLDRDSGVGIVMAPAAVRAVLAPMTVGVSFSPTLIASGSTSTLTITLTNPNQTALQNVAFTDSYPANLFNSASPSPGGSGVGCGGTLSAAPNGNSFAMTSGTVPAGGACNIFVTVTGTFGGAYLNSTGLITTPVGLNSTAASASLTIGFPPGFLSADHTTFIVGSAGNFPLSTAGYPIPSLSLTGTLPASVTFNPATAVISGVPAAGTGGVYPVTIKATNGLPPDAIQSFTLTVNESPTITSANAATFTVGTLGSFAFTTTGFPVPGIAITGALPSGVSYNPATRTISGTPLGGSGGIYPLTLTANNGVGTAMQTFTLTVNASPSITSATGTSFTEASAGAFTVTRSGFPLPTLSVTGPLPGGVTFSPSSGLLSGTPAVGTAGIYPLTFKAANGIGADANQSFTLTVTAAPVPIISTGSPLPIATVGAAYSKTFTATGGTPPYTLWSVVTGSLPPGLVLNTATGALTGTPTSSSGSPFNFTVRVTDSATITGSKAFALAVNESPMITSAASATFTEGMFGSFAIMATGSPPPSFSESGALPAGVTLDTVTGTLSGTPSAGTAGAYNVSITATNGVLPDAIQSFALTVNPPAAASQRTFVASTGSDVNPCTLAAPCRSFGTAIDKMSPGGEVIVLDSAGYGPVVIAKAVSITAPSGVYAGISVTGGGTGIIVNAVTGFVALRGLSINSVGGGVGVDFQSGDALLLDRVVVAGFGGDGIQAWLSTPATVAITDSVIRENFQGADFHLLAGASGTLRVEIDRTRIREQSFDWIGFQWRKHYRDSKAHRIGRCGQWHPDRTRQCRVFQPNQPRQLHDFGQQHIRSFRWALCVYIRDRDHC